MDYLYPVTAESIKELQDLFTTTAEAVKTLDRCIVDLRHRVEAVEELFVTKLERAEAERDEARAGHQAMVGHDLRKRLRAVAQMLIEAVGAEGPCDAEDVATRAVERIKQLEAAVLPISMTEAEERYHAEHSGREKP